MILVEFWASIVLTSFGGSGCFNRWWWWLLGGDGWTVLSGWWDLRFGGSALAGSVRQWENKHKTNFRHQQLSISAAKPMHKHQTIHVFLCIFVLVCLRGCVRVYQRKKKMMRERRSLSWFCKAFLKPKPNSTTILFSFFILGFINRNPILPLFYFSFLF